MRRKNETGQALAFTAVAMVVVLGFVGLGIDMGMMRYQKRLQQTAADAAAIAGASNLGFSGIQAGAQSAAAVNGFTDNTGGGACVAPPTSLPVGSITVTVCNPPSTGPHSTGTNPAAYVEAFVSVGQPTYFMQIFGISGETVTARAVATNYSGAGGTSGGDNTGCLFTLGPPSSSIEGVNINGSAILNAPTCGILDNGNYNTKGNKLIVNADTFAVQGTGNISGPGGSVTCSGGTSSCPTYNSPPTPDPLAGVPSPCTQGYSCTICPSGSGCTVADPAININGGTTCGTGCVYSGGTYNISPGTYSSISIQGAGSTPNVVFQPGMYIIDGAGSCSSSACFNETGNANVTGDGVTFYFMNNSTVNFAGTPNVNLTAPKTGTYSDVLMYQAPYPCSSTPCDVNLSQNLMVGGDQGPNLGGTSGSQFNGILYFPSDQMTFYGNNVSYSVGMVVSDSLNLSGNPTVNFTGLPGLPGPLPPGSTFGVGRAFLVE